MDAPEQAYINRELSWLRFNERVLQEAKRATLPLLERVKFLAIAAANLDEFFMVRVGALRSLALAGHKGRDIAGQTPRQQLAQIHGAMTRHYAELYALWDELLPALADAGIHFREPSSLTEQEEAHVASYFEEDLLPIITPVVLDLDSPNFRIPGRRVCLLMDVGAESASAEQRRWVVIPIPTIIGRFVELPSQEGHWFLRVEHLIAHCAERLFPEERIHRSTCFRMTRNADVPVHEDQWMDLAEAMEDVLAARKSSHTVRLEVPRGAPKAILEMVRKISDAPAEAVFGLGDFLDLSALMPLALLAGFDNLRESPWPSQPCTALEKEESIFSLLDQQDLLLHHPYDSFEPVLRLLEEAAADPDVLAIKQTLYRTARDSRIVSALIQAAEAGKQVTALVELKARFDEARNLERAEELDAAGVQLIYGIRGLKTHAKACLVIRREGGRIRRYMHFGTGNYNESTAKLYTDVSYLTARADFGLDATAFFNAVTGRSQFLGLRKLVPAPTAMKKTLLRYIADEAERSRLGATARIMAKMNSLQDKEMIDALLKASSAGVEIKLMVRGICCLRPGLPGLSENIEVYSLIDRYLEHSRVFYFEQGGEPALFISSADWMTRNLDKRIELLVPIEDEAGRDKLIEILERQFQDNQQAWGLGSDGEYTRVALKAAAPFRLQAHFARQSKTSNKKAARVRGAVLPVLKPSRH